MLLGRIFIRLNNDRSLEWSSCDSITWHGFVRILPWCYKFLCLCALTSVVTGRHTSSPPLRHPFFISAQSYAFHASGVLRSVQEM